MSAHTKTLEEKIAAVVRLLASDRDGEVIAAVNALKRTLASAGTDINGLAYGIENLGKSTVIPDEIKKKIWDAAVQHTENRLHSGDDFRSTDGKPTWQAVALHCQRNINRLDTRHHDFINKVAAQTVYDQEPTERMNKYLFSLFLRLGGKIICARKWTRPPYANSSRSSARTRVRSSTAPARPESCSCLGSIRSTPILSPVGSRSTTSRTW